MPTGNKVVPALIGKEKRFYITLICNWMRELEDNGLITKGQTAKEKRMKYKLLIIWKQPVDNMLFATLVFDTLISALRVCDLMQANKNVKSIDIGQADRNLYRKLYIAE